ncbi:cryptochrome/photolyase family protein [Actinoalloteichus fjordicus]|uniref:Deoxyribodipyrimidine photolyase n=1 Tax=Actinoalloteichus fjordicus TaxID=1612552 RepID=A0AAC9PV70_9PSEU|nr:deoxyribodipyrimidine photo-lyase [Actinoalloteichus fjordicus]APU17646.1 deoxyribodipyrimidine photolyase [Actinoalloteichus fjordicus]
MVWDDTSVLWFRRDLRCGDQPAMAAAGERAGRVLALFVLDDRLLGPAGAPRRTFLFRCLRALAEQLDGRLLIVHGDPVEAVAAAAEAVSARTVHVTTDTGPYGRRRDDAVQRRLAGQGVELIGTGTAYAVSPGRVRKPDGTPYRVFTPFRRAWGEHGWRQPSASDPSTIDWIDPGTLRGGPTAVPVPADDDLGEVRLPAAGERAGLDRWASFRDERLADYAEGRDRPSADGTSRLSTYLHWGCVHPRTLLADLAGDRGEGATAFRRELAWRDFLADVLWHQPESARQNLDRRFDRISYDTGPDADERFERWRTGRTGFPFVDAGMRQLAREGWMHNRVRMVAASFLVKDLHLPWWWGARHFMTALVDGDLASNQHNWQWVAGSGTDSAPYFRVFNPVTQGRRFDPDGDYVRRHVPELRGIAGKAVHEPWKAGEDAPADYPERMVDHGEERQEALRRFGEISGR